MIEEYVSYDVVSLFTNIPLDETIDYVIENIYTHKNYHKSVVSWYFLGYLKR